MRFRAAGPGNQTAALPVCATARTRQRVDGEHADAGLDGVNQDGRRALGLVVVGRAARRSRT